MIRPSCFPLPLQAEFLGNNKWKLLAPFSYVAEDKKVYTAQKGFVTDGKSIPKFAKSIIGGNWSGVGGWIAVIHDLLVNTEMSRIKADKLFLEGLLASYPKSKSKWGKIKYNLFKIKAQTMYRAVRVSAVVGNSRWWPWRKR